MYFYEFYQFLKDFEKFWKLADFWLKNDHLARCANRFFVTRSSTENVSSLWKMLLSLPKLVYMYPKVSSTIFCEQNFDFFEFRLKNWGFVDLGGWFLGFLAKNGPQGPRNLHLDQGAGFFWTIVGWFRAHFRSKSGIFPSNFIKGKSRFGAYLSARKQPQNRETRLFLHFVKKFWIAE